MLSNQKGRTVVELITGITVGAILVAGVLQTYSGFVKSNVAVKNETVLQEHLARANQVLEKDIRMAGYNVPGTGIVVDQSVADKHILRVLMNEDNLSTTLAVSVSAGNTKFLIAEDKGAQVGQWVILQDDKEFAYYEIAHVGVNATDIDTITIYGALAKGWSAAQTGIIFATCYKYSLETVGAVTSLVRRTHDDSYTISEEIDGMTITPKDDTGHTITLDIEKDARSISVVLKSLINDINGPKTVTNTVEAAIRNFS